MRFGTLPTLFRSSIKTSLKKFKLIGEPEVKRDLLYFSNMFTFLRTRYTLPWTARPFLSTLLRMQMPENHERDKLNRVMSSHVGRSRDGKGTRPGKPINLSGTGKLRMVSGPQYFNAAKSYARAAASSSSYAPGSAGDELVCN
jgi:hypothetical protein